MPRHDAGGAKEMQGKRSNLDGEHAMRMSGTNSLRQSSVGAATLTYIAFMLLLLSIATCAVLLQMRFERPPSDQQQLLLRFFAEVESIGNAASHAGQGKQEAFAQLQYSRKEGDRHYTELMQGADTGNKALKMSWQITVRAVDSLLQSKESLLKMRAGLQRMNELAPALQENSNRIEVLLVSLGARPVEVVAAYQLGMLVERMGKSAQEFVWTDEVQPETAFLLGKDVKTFISVVDGLLDGSEQMRLRPAKDAELRDRLVQLKAMYQEEYQKHPEAMITHLKELISARQSALVIGMENLNLRQQLRSRISAAQNSVSRSLPLLNVAIGLSLIGSVALLLLMLRMKGA